MYMKPLVKSSPTSRSRVKCSKRSRALRVTEAKACLVEGGVFIEKQVLQVGFGGFKGGVCREYANCSGLSRIGRISCGRSSRS